MRYQRIEPSRGWAACGLNLRELWDFRDLLLQLAQRDLKLRYKQTLLGVTWVILQPLVASLVFAVVFGRVARLPSEGLPYLLFVYTGLLPWSFVAASVQRAGSSLIADSRLIARVYFPRMLIPFASLGAVLVDFAIAGLVMLVLLFAYRVPLTPNLLALPLLIGLMLLIATGVSLGLSALTVYYRDFVHMTPFLLQVWMYASPLVYSASMVPEEWRLLYGLNPMAGLIDGFRWSLLASGSFPAPAVALAGLVGALLLLFNATLFRRVERAFADVI